MRGTEVHRQEFFLAAGIIPAYAGNSQHCSQFHAVVRDHPRVCGEQRLNVPYL